jgi:predicted CoA-binding protein
MPAEEVVVRTIEEAAAEFLSKRRIAVAGVARPPGETAGNSVYRRLRDRGYEVFAVNPNAGEVEGDPCYPSISAVPGGVEAVVVATAPPATEEVIAECAAIGVPLVWIHRGPGGGSYSESAVELGRKWGLTVIPGGCPLMYGECSDLGHRVMRWVLDRMGRIPGEV